MQRGRKHRKQNIQDAELLYSILQACPLFAINVTNDLMHLFPLPYSGILWAYDIWQAENEVIKVYKIIYFSLSR